MQRFIFEGAIPTLNPKAGKWDDFLHKNKWWKCKDLCWRERSLLSAQGLEGDFFHINRLYHLEEKHFHHSPPRSQAKLDKGSQVQQSLMKLTMHISWKENVSAICKEKGLISLPESEYLQEVFCNVNIRNIDTKRPLYEWGHVGPKETGGVL